MYYFILKILKKNSSKQQKLCNTVLKALKKKRKRIKKPKLNFSFLFFNNICIEISNNEKRKGKTIIRTYATAIY